MTIKEITHKLFSVNFDKDLDDDNISDAYENMAEKLIKNNKWSDVYACWYDYLVNECKTVEKIVNYANLFWLYEGYKQIIPNAVEFCAYFYANISFQHYSASTAVIDGIAWYALVNSGIISKNDLSFDNFAPYDFPIITDAINKWKEKGYGLY